MKLFEIDNETFLDGCINGRLLGKHIGQLSFTKYYSEDAAGLTMYYGRLKVHDTELVVSLTISEVDVPVSAYKWSLSAGRYSSYSFEQNPNCDCNMYKELAGLVEAAVNDILETGIEPQHHPVNHEII